MAGTRKPPGGAKKPPARAKKVRGSSMPSFEESAKKFKPGPVAPPEREEDRADMSGAARVELRPAHEQLAVSMHLPAAGTPGEDEMPEGTPGTLTKMPGEEGE